MDAEAGRMTNRTRDGSGQWTATKPLIYTRVNAWLATQSTALGCSHFFVLLKLNSTSQLESTPIATLFVRSRWPNDGRALRSRQCVSLATIRGPYLITAFLSRLRRFRLLSRSRISLMLEPSSACYQNNLVISVGSKLHFQLFQTCQ